MSFTFVQKDGESVPIAKEAGTKRIIFINPDDVEPEPSTRHETDGHQYQCPICHKILNTKSGYKYHTSKHCKISANYEIQTTNEINPIPTIKRQILYVAGSQNSGKSYRVACYINYWLKMFPDKKVIVISRLDHDETFDLPEFASGQIEQHIVRMKPNVSWIENKFQLSDFHDSLVVFDDIMSSNWSNNPDPKEASKENKLIQSYIHDLIIDMSQNGRHENIHMVITSHDLYDHQRTSKLISDATDYIIFPGTTGEYHLNYFLREYVGMTKSKIDLVKSLKSRWILIHKDKPKYIMYSHGVMRYDLI